MISRKASSGHKLGQLIGDWFEDVLARGGAPGFINIAPLGLGCQGRCPQCH